MIIHARDAEHGQTLRTDVCIVGGGVAGIVLAKELLNQPFETCMLESGGFDPDTAEQELARGENAGLPYYPLDENRQRMYGGTSHLWAGWCRPLDALDFQARPWVPHGGWPFGLEELTPYYRRSHPYFELGEFEYGLDYWANRLGEAGLPLAKDRVVTKFYHLSPPTRFGQHYRDLFAGPSSGRVCLGANVREIETDAEGTAVTRVRVQTREGNEFFLQAQRYVLAVGGVENARLLLASNRTHPCGIGNRHDWVGRYFMEHLHFPCGVIWLDNTDRFSTGLYWKSTAVAARLFLADAVAERERLLNYNAMLEPLYDTGTAITADAMGPNGPHRLAAFRLHHTLEQAPNPDSRVTLSAECDSLGMPRARLDWRLSPLDRHTFVRSLAILGHEFRRAGIGQLEVRKGDNDTSWPPQPLQGKRGHHMGTTRMSRDPGQGVVDENCRVHGVRNLFIAGSSVFPTSGAGTPTITIAALAIRLADHLKAVERPTRRVSEGGSLDALADASG